MAGRRCTGPGGRIGGLGGGGGGGGCDVSYITYVVGYRHMSCSVWETRPRLHG